MTEKPIHKILIANRGEIVSRIIRAAKLLGIKPAVVYLADDVGLNYLKEPVEKHLLEGVTLAETYLNSQKLVDLAITIGADAIHPGYGFLSEDPAFAKLCESNGITWIGPSSGVMQAMSLKPASRRKAVEAGIPVIPVITGSLEELKSKSATLPYPVMIKARNGGGGRGIRIIQTQEEFNAQIHLAAEEAQKYFGYPEVFVEQYIENAKHIEVQVIGDHFGHLVHLFERECTIQRRFQKILEESPSPSLSDTLRTKILEAAVKLAKAVGYNSAGTLEFLLDPKGQFYFIEMNTRIQVEHPVTEMVTGVDLVMEQIRVASGLPLSISQSQISTSGHALECRICAEDPALGFTPSPGQIFLYNKPSGIGVRIEDSFDTGAEISSRYDSMIAKMIVHSPDRDQTIKKTLNLLDQWAIHGPIHNIPFLKEVIRSKSFRQNHFYTNYIDLHAGQMVGKLDEKKRQVKTAIFAAAFGLIRMKGHSAHPVKGSLCPWTKLGNWRMINHMEVDVNGHHHQLDWETPGNDSFLCTLDDLKISMELAVMDPVEIHFFFEGDKQKLIYSELPDRSIMLTQGDHTFTVTESYLTRSLGNGNKDSDGHQKTINNRITAPLPGRITRLLVTPGQVVEQGSSLLTIESMKTENQVLATGSLTIRSIRVETGQDVKVNQVLMEYDLN